MMMRNTHTKRRPNGVMRFAGVASPSHIFCYAMLMHTYMQIQSDYLARGDVLYLLFLGFLPIRSQIPLNSNQTHLRFCLLFVHCAPCHSQTTPRQVYLYKSLPSPLQTNLTFEMYKIAGTLLRRLESSLAPRTMYWPTRSNPHTLPGPCPQVNSSTILSFDKKNVS